jgi:hypothetical protein
LLINKRNEPVQVIVNGQRIPMGPYEVDLLDYAPASAPAMSDA